MQEQVLVHHEGERLDLHIEQQPSISVVSPTLNQRSYIDDAINSVALQKSSIVEHFVLDGGSTDGTVEFVRSLTNSPGFEHLRLVAEPDDGQSDAINKGLLLATGEILAWLNTDDYYLPGALGLVATAFAANPDVDVLYGEAQFVAADGTPIRVKRDHAFDLGILLYYGCYIMSTATFFRRRIIDDGELLDTGFRVTMDFEYYVRLARLGYKFGFLPRTLAAFRWHDTNVSVLNSERRRTERRQVQRRFGGLRWISDDRARDAAFQVLDPLFRAKRVARRTLERVTRVRDSGDVL